MLIKEIGNLIWNFGRSVATLLIFTIIIPSHSYSYPMITSGPLFLNSISGNWHSTSGTVLNFQGSSCNTTQSFAFFTSGINLANFSYSFSCSNGYQGQMQGLDFNPNIGTYQNGYNTITSRYLYLNGGIVGLERKMMTTWGFGSMINYQYQTVQIFITKQNSDGSPLSIALELNNSQTNVMNGQATVYHLELVKN